MSTSRKPPDPLAPITYIVNVIATLFALIVILIILEVATGSGSAFGFGHDAEVCVTASPGVGVPYGGADGLPRDGLVGIHSGVRSFPDKLRICDARPSVGMRLVSSVPQVLGLAFIGGFLAFTRLLVRHARRRGLFTASVARRVTLLGFYILLGSLGIAAISSIADGMVLHHDLRAASWGWGGFAAFSLSLPTLVGGFGIITFGRVMQLAVGMQEEIDATI